MEIGQKVIVTGGESDIKFYHAIGTIKNKQYGLYAIDFKADYLEHPEHYKSRYHRYGDAPKDYFHICEGAVASGYGYYCSPDIVHPYQPIRQKSLALYKRSKEKEDEG